MARRIPLIELSNNFASIVHKVIEEYGEQLEANMDPVLKEVAEEVKNDLYSATPRTQHTNSKYGHLRDNMKVTKRTKNGDRQYVVHYGDKGWLSTLLEYGWTTKSGKMIRRTPFIKPTYERNKEKYIKMVRDGLERQVKK